MNRRQQESDAEHTGEDIESLRATIVEREEQIRQLEEELAETNKGVVALYAELDDQAVALRDATELKSRFLSYMSHEFRTPLGAIRSIARIMLDHMDGPLTTRTGTAGEFYSAVGCRTVGDGR